MVLRLFLQIRLHQRIHRPTDGLKEDIKNKMNRREEPEDVLAADLVQQLEDLTVEKPLLDEEGKAIVHFYVLQSEKQLLPSAP